MHGSYGLLWLHGPQKLTQNLVAAGPWSQAWLSAAARFIQHYRSGWQYRSLASVWLWWWHSSGTPIRPQVVAQLPGLCGLLWQHRHWTSTQNLAGLGSWTQTWFSAAAWSGCHNCPKWQYWLFRLLWSQRQHGPSTSTCPQVVAKTTDIVKAFNGNRRYRHEHRP